MEDFSNNTGQNTGKPLETTAKSPAGQNLGIAALITAIVTFVLAVIPCIGIIAMIPGLIAIVLASVGLSQATRNDSPRGVLIAALIIAVVATLISFSQIFVAGKIGNKFENKWGKDIESIINDVQENVKDQLEDVNVNIKVQSNGDTVEINTNADKTNRHQELEDLEKANTGSNDTLEKKK
jgi:hypothetical protein